MRLFSSFLSSVFSVSAGEVFFVACLETRMARLYRLAVERETSTLTVLEALESPVASLESSALVEALRRMSRGFLDFKKSRILILTTACLATVVSVKSLIVREDSDRELDQAELENCFTQAIWQVFDRERAAAGIKMRISDLEVAVADARLLTTALDQHVVPNPIGFMAREVLFSFELVLSPKSFLRQLYEFISEEQLVFISDRGAIYSQFLERSLAKSLEFSLLYIDERSSDFYVNGFQDWRFLGEPDL